MSRFDCIWHNMLSYINKWSKYPTHKSELVSHLNVDNSEIFDTHTWTPKQRGDIEITDVLNRDFNSDFKKLSCF